MPELYEVLDPRPFAASAPYTYFLPDMELLKAVGVGDHVKAVLRAVPASEKYDAERMWIRVSSVNADWLEVTSTLRLQTCPNCHWDRRCACREHMQSTPISTIRRGLQHCSQDRNDANTRSGGSRWRQVPR